MRVSGLRFSDLRFSLSNVMLLANLAFMLAGGSFAIMSGVCTLLVFTLADGLAGDDLSGPTDDPSGFLDAMLVLTLPLMALNSLVLAYYFTPGDPLGLSALLARFGLDFDAARASAGGLGKASALISLGMFTGAAMNVAHELTHRTTEPGKFLIGRWLSAFTWESSFSLQHSQNHHLNVGFYHDPGTARRGENVYAFVLRASIGNNIAAFRNEAARLRRRGLPLWSLRNQFLAGQAMTLAIAAAYMLVAGWAGLAVFFIVGLQGRFYLEGSAYIEHYGLARLPGTRTESRHAWNTYRRLSNGLLYNVARHADHHANATKAFYKLEVDAGAPVLPAGYLTMMLAAAIPPLWEAIMRPRLADWDANYATPQEARYAATHEESIEGMLAAE